VKNPKTSWWVVAATVAVAAVLVVLGDDVHVGMLQG
jgi:hypothetical protein